MTLIYHDTQSGVTLKERGGKIVLPSGKTVLCKGAKPNPELRLYRYIEEGPKRPQPGKRIEQAISLDGENYTITRTEVDDPNFDLDSFKAQRVAAIKQEAGDVILRQFPDWKQRNMNMRATELQEIRLDGVALTAGEQAESNALKLAAQWIKSIRAASGVMEDEIKALTTAAEVSIYHAVWPELTLS
ncbi:MAG: hypothetical protein OQJ97_02715 [Rhodospirillales bacterium]|nr:hypothetical protein [Rhodospirillales bacterium]